MNSLADGQMTEEGFLKGEIIKLSDDRAEIILDDGQGFFWPVKDLPKDLEEGDEIKIFLTIPLSSVIRRGRPVLSPARNLTKTPSPVLDFLNPSPPPLGKLEVALNKTERPRGRGGIEEESNEIAKKILNQLLENNDRR
ncbi:hypothetical protein HYZ76_00605 [Candidatus Falkowbacteria bacterium]|nr:hypothetical protein [Candidatus Falkowbacteria bacterium]